MRFVPGWPLLILCIVLVVPAMTVVFFDQGSLRLIAGGIILLWVFISLIDVFLSLNILKQLYLEHPKLLRCTKGRDFDFYFKFFTKNAEIPWIRYSISTTPHYRIIGYLVKKIDTIKSTQAISSLFEIVVLQRGQFFIDSAHVETRSKFGLWLIRKDFQVEIEIRSYPDLTVERKKLSSLFLMKGANGSHSVRQIGKGREFEQLREYQSGDDYTDIDWKATARRRMPVTRTFQMERTQEVYVVVDHSRFSGREIRVPVEEEQLSGDYLYEEMSAGGKFEVTTQLEKFLHCALVLASAAESQGDLFGFISFADKVDRFIRSRNGKQHYNVIRDALYTLEPSRVTPDYEQLMISLRQKLTRRALIVMLVDLSDPLTSEQFFESLPLISKQHLILVNMVRPEMAHPLFTGGEDPQNSLEIYDKLAGHFQWQEIKETAKKLSNLGVELGVPDHEELCTEAVSQYLSVKKRQLI